MDSTIEEIRQRTEAATPGPWVVKVKGNTVESHQVMSPGNGPVCSAISPRTKNAQFIAHSRDDIPYLLSEVDRLNALHKREIIVTGEYAQRVIDLTARAEAAEARADAAVEDMTAVLKRDSDDICAYCKNLIECKGEGCECFEQGKGGTIDGKEYPDFKWTCMDFDYGTCSLLADTPCNGCFENDCSGFEWRGPQTGKGEAE